MLNQKVFTTPLPSSLQGSSGVLLRTKTFDPLFPRQSSWSVWQLRNVRHASSLQSAILDGNLDDLTLQKQEYDVVENSALSSNQQGAELDQEKAGEGSLYGRTRQEASKVLAKDGPSSNGLTREGSSSPNRAKRTRSEAPSAISGHLTSAEWRDLKEIPGVGVSNAKRLAISGIKSSQAVLETYQKMCKLDPEQFVSHLKDKVGIKQKKWRDQIANYCKAQYAGELDQHNKRYWTTLSVEGNISAGKSTFLNGIARFCPDLQNLLHVSPEPVGQWQNIGGGSKYNLLEEFYQDKARFAYTFQNYIFITRLLQEQESAAQMLGQPYRLLERSVWCDRMVFVQSLMESGLLSEMEMTLYQAWFDPLVDQHPTLVPDGFIYLRAGPETCMDRLKVRSRSEETGVDIKYLEDLHQRHEKWLFEVHNASVSNLLVKDLGFIDQRFISTNDKRVVEATRRTMENFLPEIPDKIKGDVKILNNTKDKDAESSSIPSKIQNLPALVLDCEKDIHDLDAQKEHAEKVTAYFEYVKAVRYYRNFVKKLERAPVLDQAWRSLVLPNNGALDPLTSRQYFTEYERNRLHLAHA